MALERDTHWNLMHPSYAHHLSYRVHTGHCILPAQQVNIDA